MNGNELGEARELELALVIADLSGYTAFTETHGALYASEIVLRFQRLAAASLEPGVVIVNSVGDDRACRSDLSFLLAQVRGRFCEGAGVIRRYRVRSEVARCA